MTQADSQSPTAITFTFAPRVLLYWRTTKPKGLTLGEAVSRHTKAFMTQNFCLFAHIYTRSRCYFVTIHTLSEKLLE